MGNIELMDEAFKIAHEVNIAGINERVFRLLEDKKRLEDLLKKEQMKKDKLFLNYELLLLKIAKFDVNEKEELKILQHEALKTLDLIEIVKG